METTYGTQTLLCGEDKQPADAQHLGGVRFFTDGLSSIPAIEDPQIKRSFKDLLATNWDNLPSAVIHDAKKALSKSTDEKAAQDSLKNVFRAAEAVEEFTGIVMLLKMELDDAIGLSGENVRPLPEEYQKAIKTLFNRYNEYLAAFELNETYLKKKVESELGSKMIYLKMRCGGLEADWGKIYTHVMTMKNKGEACWSGDNSEEGMGVVLGEVEEKTASGVGDGVDCTGSEGEKKIIAELEADIEGLGAYPCG